MITLMVEFNRSTRTSAASTDTNRGIKRKASSEETQPRKKIKLTELGQTVRGERKKNRKEALLKKKTWKRKVPKCNQDDKSSSSVDTDCSTSSTSQTSTASTTNNRGIKRKASSEETRLTKKMKFSRLAGPSDTEDEGPSSKTMTSKDQKENVKISADSLRNEFEAKYQQCEQLGEGGCGCVFAGYRIADNLPVAIKHIPADKVYIKHVDKDGKQLPAEVAVMLKLAATTSGSARTSSSVSLLDWYDLDQELILVLERPVPSNDLLTYLSLKGGLLPEEEAKNIMKQLVDEAIELERNSIFHRDIKIENILIETSSNVPRVRLIDFGLSCFFNETSIYEMFFGTPSHSPPEWLHRGRYKAGPSTVWQLGVVLFEIINAVFETSEFLSMKLKISEALSEDCSDFLRMCLKIIPEYRATLKELQRHPWLQ